MTPGAKYNDTKSILYEEKFKKAHKLAISFKPNHTWPIKQWIY